ncbi:hypothetical protein RB653_002587 [Dictyostelium firmibasis]|uniref:Uncharacterized protein n=1 Tax=Dictyostelium firmibasis TaxID=79012 RepID=A0AAN7TQS6_9MYCE
MIVPEYEKTFKISIIGDSGCGKTRLLLRFTDDTYSENYISTIGVEFKTKTIYVDGIGIKLHIYDSGGCERIRTQNFGWLYRGCSAVIIVYDCTNEISFKNVDTWLCDANRYTAETCIKCIVGNKSDLEDENVVDLNLVNQFAAKENIKFYETSAKNSKNVEECFISLAKDLLKEDIQNEEIRESQINIDEKSQCLIN